MTMEEKHNNATHNRPEGSRIIDAASMQIDLPTFIKEIKHEDSWKKNDRNAITVLKTSHITLVLGGMHKGARIDKQHTDGLITIQILEGCLDIYTSSLITFTKGQIAMIHEGQGYDIVAKEETLYLLTTHHLKG